MFIPDFINFWLIVLIGYVTEKYCEKWRASDTDLHSNLFSLSTRMGKRKSQEDRVSYWSLKPANWIYSIWSKKILWAKNIRQFLVFLMAILAQKQHNFDATLWELNSKIHILSSSQTLSQLSEEVSLH